MSELPVPILILISAAAAVMILYGLKSRLKFSTPHKTVTVPAVTVAGPPDLKVLNCRVRLAEQEKNNLRSKVFAVEICGSIDAPGDMCCTTLRISIADITDGLDKTMPVRTEVKQWQMQDSSRFCYSVDLGNLPNSHSTFPDWICVAKLNPGWILFPRKGKRVLHLGISILSRQSGQELACAEYTFNYENNAFGYVDLQENVQRTKNLAVALAFAIGAADGKLFNSEIELIKSWAKGNIDAARQFDKAKRKLDKALDKVVRFLRKGNRFDTYKICNEIVVISLPAERYDILKLCMQVAAADGVAAAEEVAMLKNLAKWLEVDADRFLAMMGKILPAGMHEVKDVEVILGVTADMDKEDTRKLLNREYRKWNSRVTNSDPEIRNQADCMLNIIAQARSEYVG